MTQHWFDRSTHHSSNSRLCIDSEAGTGHSGHVSWFDEIRVNNIISVLDASRILFSCISNCRNGFISCCVDSNLPAVSHGVTINRVQGFNLLLLVAACQGKRSVSVGIVWLAHPGSPASWYAVCKNLELRNGDLITSRAYLWWAKFLQASFDICD